MNKKFIIIVSLLIFCFAYTGKTMAAPERIFYMNKAKEKEAILSVKKNYKKIDILAPQSYVLTAGLKLAGGSSVALKKVIKDYKLKTMPLVANDGFKQSTIHNLLLNETAQNNFIADLIKTAKKENYIGWQYDFENINYTDKDLYSAFAEKTGAEFKKNNLVFSIAVVTRQTDYEDTNAFKNWGGVFDYKRLANTTDFISVMTYDDPNSKGPVASLPFVNNCLAYLKDKIPAEKLSLGIPLYYWSWQTNPAKKINVGGNFTRLLNIMANNRHITGFDASLATAWMSYVYNKKQYVFWYTDKKTMQLRMELIKQNNLRGFSAWMLGVEDPGIWQTF